MVAFVVVAVFVSFIRQILAEKPHNFSLVSEFKDFTLQIRRTVVHCEYTRFLLMSESSLRFSLSTNFIFWLPWPLQEIL